MMSSKTLIVTSAFAAMLFSANVAAPLYGGYAEKFGFSTALVAVIFAVYALVLIPALLGFGQVSDAFGRRPVIAAGLGLAIVALALFVFAQSTAWLFAARAVQGLAQGAMGGAATAALAELVEGHDTRKAALLATLAQAGGCASGALVGGMLAHGLGADGAPLRHRDGVLRLGDRGASGGPGDRREGPGGQAADPAPARARGDPGRVFRVGLTGASVWAVAGGLFLSVMPTYAGKLVLHTQNLALLGLIAALVLACSCLAQLAIRRGTPAAETQAAGLVLLALGLLCLVLSASLHAPALLIVGAVLAGIGHGLAFLAAQENLTRIAPADQRAEVSAAFYVCVYLGVALSVIGVGVLAAAHHALHRRRRLRGGHRHRGARARRVAFAPPVGALGAARLSVVQVFPGNVQYRRSLPCHQPMLRGQNLPSKGEPWAA